MLGLLILFAVAAAIILLLGTLGVAYSITHPTRKTYAVALAKGEPTEPADVGLTGEAVTWTLHNHIESPSWILRGEQPDAPAIIIVHGHRNSRYGALRRAAKLAEFASKIVVFDLPGHGDTLGGRCSFGAQEAADVANVVEQFGETRVVLFGSSHGAGIAIAAAGDYPKHIVGLIVEGPFRYWHEPVGRVMKLRRYPVQPFLILGGLWMRMMGMKLSYDRAEQAARLNIPLLVLHGEDDPVCPIDSARAIAQAGKGEFVVFADAQHEDLSQTDVPLYREVVGRFFKTLAR